MKSILIFVVSFLVCSQAFSQKIAELKCRHLPTIQQGFLNQHILQKKADKNLEARVIGNYIDKLDSSKLTLLEGDIKKIKKSMKGIFQKLLVDDCSSLIKAHDLYVMRVQQKTDFVKKYLGPNFKLDKSVVLDLDSKKRKFSKNEKQLQALYSKYLHFQIANYVTTDHTLAEAKKLVIKNHERSIKKVKEIKQTTVFADYLNAFSGGLDPHSTFFSPESFADFNISMRLSLEGIGASLSWKDGLTIVEQLIPGGAAGRSGKIKPKDKIVAVAQGANGKFEPVMDWDLKDVVNKIRGKKGTTVVLSILRKEKGSTIKFKVSLVRDTIKLEDQAARLTYHNQKIENKNYKIGLLNLPSFYADSRRGGRSSANDMKVLLAEAKKNKVDALVLDLSNNGGGSLPDAVNGAGLFFKKGNVVKQSSRDSRSSMITLADRDGAVDFNGPCVVLTSRISASASEIVAGTLQDYGRCVVVGGDHTFGKGSVQSVSELPRGLGAIKVTVGMFFIPGGKSTQHKGVDGDIVFPSVFANEDIGEKTLDYSLPPKTIPSFTSEQAYVLTGNESWRVVDKEAIGHLKSKSALRVSKDEKFNEILDELKKAKEKGKIVKIADLFKKEDDKKDKKKEEEEKVYTLTQEEKDKKYLERPDVKEAMYIAADLAEYFQRAPLAGSHSKRKAASKK